MKGSTRFIISLIIIVPVLVLGLISVAPHPLAVVSSWKEARLAAAQSRFMDAANAYREIIEFQPERMDLWDTVGGLAFQASDNAGAVEAYQRAETAGVISNDGLFNLGAAYRNLGENLQAWDAWRRLAKMPGLKSEQYARLVEALRQSGDFDGALQAARAWSRAFPKNPQAAYAYGLHLSTIDPALALEILLPVSEEDIPESRKSQALIKGLETVAGHTQQEYGMVVIGQRLLEIQEFDLAEHTFLQAVDLNPDYAEAWVMLSEAEQSLGKDGWPALEKAQTLAPTSNMVWVEMALYYRRQGKPDKALPFLIALAEANPKDASWLTEIGATVAEQGDLIEALAYYQKAAELEPKNAAIWRALAEFAAENGFDAQTISIPAAEKSLELDAEDPLSLDMMGWILLIEGELDQAEQFLQQALEKDAANARAKLHLAQVYLEKNNFSLAYKLLSQAAAQTKDPFAALQAQRLLDHYFPLKP